MTKITLYGREISPPCRAVLLAIKALSLDIEFIQVNLLKEENKTEEFLKINPQHTIPVLIDDGKTICDSHAIVTYLIGKYGKDDTLYPKDLYQRAIIDHRLHFDSGILYVRFKNIAGRLLFKSDLNALQEAFDEVNEAYDLLEIFLRSSKFLAGNEMTVADFCCLATVSSLHTISPLDSIKHSNVINWLRRMEQLPYYQEANGRGLKAIIDFNSKNR